MADLVIDSHQHFWDLERGDYGWISGPFQPIRRSFSPDDLLPCLTAAGVAGTVLVQTCNDLGETREFLRLAGRTDFIAGVVGWVDLTDPAVAETLAELKSSPEGRWLVGIRHLIHEEPDAEWLLREDVRRGLKAVAEAGLVYDLVPKENHLPAVLKTVADFPDLRFVLDHLAKPDIAHGRFSSWSALMRGFAAHRGHVWCKLSGMVTEADWRTWSPSDLQPYVDEALAVFEPHRCMFGTDWPVCLVAGSYEKVTDALRSCVSHRTMAERAQIFGLSAVEAYRLPGLHGT